jgi:hypothetical protein
MISIYNYSKSPFLSVIEKVKTPLHISLYNKEHTDFEETTKLNKLPYALQYIHGSNVANSVRGYAIDCVNISDYGFAFVAQRSFIAMLVETYWLNAKKQICKAPNEIKVYLKKRLNAIRRFFGK